MKRITNEGKPVVVVPVVLEPIEIRIALRAIEPDFSDMSVAFERNVPSTTYATVLRVLSGLYLIRDRKSLSARHRVSSFLKNF
ncbi:hypothetical protein A3I27_00480 [Candidatus Giovannonibacteria bacterium RIFCSPLOWO2_02_FULL_43_11b]|uniref:Uncharacterized protein n=1 Tax=Candidatus Giovannonibacteria bacterium RIFCSPHIGHO2_12_FULL_43_15 TaxID=1798341 RepID=A0A1F5WR61_9BACT|nr:MAG: hypothetical protein A2739_01725 [Candidatus Giovannonibacteria bacterium RIFCSPHIGHO2_01_FULL_43_100]OGF66928.1 MAG: hypothetical protein A3B97_03575 [Candidatus Giovannonibacteria bacterium RIFCSPHIGHO2_02_FULL_43_32]OGF78110.1 MAG: hypothetical protein A3F23_02830 [Candidatus Giovannonibacteria bacterium RIFCSPHIGHO2_12_FULL_43_15]OGF78517.1 MAG: hypothetical protein A3A15_02730 [Candidatus Giovannonibacteria bacterium RIFCSPLOWO2_01_FULL_43_60]OGF89467.1 MAG: hypothetical protein A3